MARGPLPKPGAQRRRTNTPSIPTTNLPAGGFRGRVPKCSYALGIAGKAWWRWAWKTPSAAAWGPGDTYFVSRRAQLEDDLAVMPLPNLNPDDVKVFNTISTARVRVQRMMGDIDKRLGLDPKALSELRWSLTDDTPEATVTPLATVPDAWRNAAAAG